jgi:hypothetical protein
MVKFVTKGKLHMTAERILALLNRRASGRRELSSALRGAFKRAAALIVIA